ncbi:MAG: translocation/assembly module TamB [Deltaproteobacteria bacterium]|nr:MAG: translocation/assembly module TamB [Deltaproteobacteria bacterium]
MTVSREAVSTTGLALAADAQRVTLAGRVGLTGPSDASLDVVALELAPFCTLAGDERCGGTVSLQARVAGTAEAPRLSATLRSDALSVRDVELGMLTLDTRYGEQQATVHGFLRHPQAGELRVDGTAPIDLAWGGPRRDTSEEPLTIRVWADRLDLGVARALAPTQVREVGGRLAVDVRVTGSRNAPRAEGNATLSDGRLVLVATGAAYEDIRAELAAGGDAVRLTALHARGGDGALDGTGRVRLARGEPAGLDLRFELHDFFAVRRPEVEATLSGAVRVGGTIAAPDVEGDLQVEQAVARPAALPAQSGAAEPDPTIVIVDGHEPHEAAPETPSLVRTLGLSVTMRIARNAWVRRADADIELGGELKIAKAADEGVRIVGTIRLLRGWYVFQGRRFTLDEGTITFTGATPPNPTFDVTAIFKNPNYRVTVHLGGTSEKPELTLASDPPLEQADILSVIIFGKPARDLGKGESVKLQEQALQLASGYVMPELRTSVMNTLGLDTLDVEMPQGADRRGRVSVGRYVAGDVFVSLAQEFGARAGQAVGVEYGLTPQISIKGSTSTRGDSAIDVFWHRRY